MPSAKVDIATGLKRLRAVPGLFEEVMKATVPQEARGFVKDIIAISPPASKRNTGTAAKKAGEASIDADLAGLFAGVVLKGTRTIPLLFGQADPPVEKKPPYHVPTKEVHPDVRAIYLRRKDKRSEWSGLWGRITRGQRAKFYVAREKLEALAKALKAKVGSLAAGYNAAAQRLGVPVPGWIARHGSRYGSVQVRQTSSSLVVIIANSIHFARAQKLHELAAYCAYVRQKKLDRRMPYLVKAALKKAGLKVA